MAPNLVKSSSQLSLDVSNHFNFSLEAPVSVYPQLSDSDILAYEDNSHHHQHDSSSIFSAPFKRSNSVIYNLIVQDEAHWAVSCQQIEANLISEAIKREETSNQEYIVNRNHEEESYWDMPPGDCCDNALEEESKVLSTPQVERNLIQDALRRFEEVKQNKDGGVVVNNHPNNAYWFWPSEPVLESEKKASMIAYFLLEESIRQKLSIDHISKNEVSNKIGEVQQEVVESENMSTDYWYWNSEEEAKEEIVAPHVYDLTHPNHAYWDFPSEPTSADEMKQKIIDNILKEERIREMLSAGKTEERELKFHRSREENKEDCTSKEYCFGSENELNSMPANYWDFNASAEENDLISLLSEEKQALIRKILKEEEQGFVVSTKNIENQLIASQTSEVARQVESSSLSTSYWDW